MGLLNLLFGSSEDRKKEIESIEDDLVHIYVYSRERLAKMSDEDKKDLWYEEEFEREE